MSMGEFYSLSNDRLNKLPKVEEGTLIECTRCGKDHPLECATTNNKKTKFLMFYECGEKCYLGAIDNKLVVNVKSDQ